MAKQKLDWSRATRKSGLHAVGMATPDGRMWLGTATYGSKSTTLEPYKKLLMIWRIWIKRGETINFNKCGSNVVSPHEDSLRFEFDRPNVGPLKKTVHVKY